jgi:hypothetical protein
MSTVKSPLGVRGVKPTQRKCMRSKKRCHKRKVGFRGNEYISGAKKPIVLKASLFGTVGINNC